MPVYDRYWRLGVASMLLFGFLTAGLFAWHVLTGGSLEHLLGPGITYSNTCQAVWIVLVLWTVISHLTAARKRDGARHAALRGDLDAMPPSRIVPMAVDVVTAELQTARSVISADDVGLHFHRIGKSGHEVSVPWGEARLLEVWHSTTGQRERGFSLYGQRAKIEWWLPRNPQMRLQKQMNAEEALLAAIHSRAGLAPRTLAPALRAPDSRPVERHGPNPFGTILTVFIALLPFMLATVSMRLPLTAEPALNAYVALTFSVLGLLVVVAAVQALTELIQRVPLPDPSAILPPGAPPPDSLGTGIYALRWRQRRLTQLGEGVLGALFAGNIVPLIGILLGSETAAAGDLKVILNVAVGAVALLGIALVLDGALSGHHTVSADARGLTSGRQRLRWAGVEEVVARVPGSELAVFKVVGEEGDVTIEWPAKVHATPRPGVQSVSPTELAALAVARSGKALRVAGD